MANTTLKFGNGNWAIKEDSALAYSDQYDNFKPLPFDFSRASSGTIVNKEGLIETVGNGIPRIDFSDSADGALLLEPQRTNLATYSEDFDNASWNKFNSAGSSTPIISSNYGISPDGTQNADRIQVSRGSDALDYSSVYKSITISSSSRYLSVWLKSLSGTPTIIIGQKNGVYVSQQITTEWVRYELDLGVGTFTELFLSVGGAYYASGVDESADFLAWGYQLEAASYATSYIPTQGSTSTRVAETCNNSGSAQDFNSEEGVLYAEISALHDSGHRYISLNNSSITNRITIELYPNTETLVSRLTTNGVQKAFLVATNIVKTNMNKIAVRYYLNNFSFWVNGNKISEDLTDVPVPIGLNSLDFKQGNNSGDFHGKVKNLQVFNKALTDRELEILTIQ